MHSGDRGRANGKGPLIEKLRRLVSHPATEEPVRRIAQDKLTILSPRDRSPVPGSPRRRASDPWPSAGHVPAAAQDHAGQAGPEGRGAVTGAAERFCRVSRPQGRVLDMLV